MDIETLEIYNKNATKYANLEIDNHNDGDNAQHNEQGLCSEQA